MHELSIATAIVNTARSEAAARGGARLVTVGVCVGVASGVDPDALQFGFDVLVKDTDLDGLQLEIERAPHRRRCPSCDQEFESDRFMIRCPECGELRTEFLGGDEMEIRYLELEDECNDSS